MEELIKYLEDKMNQCKELGGMEKEHWAFTQAYKKANELQLHKTQVSGSVSIQLEDWDYTCGDGCCTSYGTKLIFNGKELEHPDKDILDNSYVGVDVKTSLTAVLNELGFNVTFE